jgi:hypothetical protein
MIVLDENVSEKKVTRWAKGKVVSARDLRSGSKIPDDAIPMLLRQQKQPTFVTTNATDFWRRAPAHNGYCIICLPLSNERQVEIPDILRRLFRLSDFKTKAMRMGKVIYVGDQQIQFYEAGETMVHTTGWE